MFSHKQLIKKFIHKVLKRIIEKINGKLFPTYQLLVDSRKEFLFCRTCEKLKKIVKEMEHRNKIVEKKEEIVENFLNNFSGTIL